MSHDFYLLAYSEPFKKIRKKCPSEYFKIFHFPFKSLVHSQFYIRDRIIFQYQFLTCKTFSPSSLVPRVQTLSLPSFACAEVDCQIPNTAWWRVFTLNCQYTVSVTKALQTPHGARFPILFSSVLWLFFVTCPSMWMVYFKITFCEYLLQI